MSTDTPPSDPPAPARRIRGGRVAVAAVCAAALGAGVLGVANSLDSEPREAAKRQEPLNVGVGAAIPDPNDTTVPATPEPAPTLPPLTVVLDRPAPGGVADLDAAGQIVRLRDIVHTDRSARRYVEMGRAQLELGDATSAAGSFRKALARRPKDPAALTGLVFVDFLSGPAGERRASAAMSRLAKAHPRNQLVMFNQGWLAAYARDPKTVAAAWQATAKLNPGTPLGRVANSLLQELSKGSG